MSIQDPESSEQNGIAASGGANTPEEYEGKNGGNGIPGWLGWTVVLAILFMMVAALVLGVQRLQEGTATLPRPEGSRATPLPAIGSMEVEPQTEVTGTVGSATVAEGETGADSGAVAETTSPSEDSDETADNGEQSPTVAISGTVEEASASSSPSGAQRTPELLATAATSDAAAILPLASLALGIPIIPTATDVPATGIEPAGQSPIATTFARIRRTPRGATPRGATPTMTATSAPTVTATGIEPTERSPIATTFARIRGTPRGATPTMTATSAPTVTPTETPAPTDTATPVATSQPTVAATPTAGSADDAEGSESIEPGSVVVAQAQVLVLRTEASTSSLIMETYDSGAEFEVLEPGDSVESYPVVVNGVGWIRVRAEDGLVGWVDDDDVRAQRAPGN